ncbi:hypothetical protein SAMN06296386_10855 [Lachnospiraceae bacterium]|nr:hypothetical protein SAMN06296386_10855 [Lachnospiraceae bacterium]
MFKFFGKRYETRFKDGKIILKDNRTRGLYMMLFFIFLIGGVIIGFAAADGTFEDVGMSIALCLTMWGIISIICVLAEISFVVTDEYIVKQTGLFRKKIWYRDIEKVCNCGKMLIILSKRKENIVNLHYLESGAEEYIKSSLRRYGFRDDERTCSLVPGVRTHGTNFLPYDNFVMAKKDRFTMYGLSLFMLVTSVFILSNCIDDIAYEKFVYQVLFWAMILLMIIISVLMIISYSTKIRVMDGRIDAVRFGMVVNSMDLSEVAEIRRKTTYVHRSRGASYYTEELSFYDRNMKEIFLKEKINYHEYKHYLKLIDYLYDKNMPIQVRKSS